MIGRSPKVCLFIFYCILNPATVISSCTVSQVKMHSVSSNRRTEAAMDCCNQVAPDFNGQPELFDVNKVIGRRTALKRLAGLAGGVMFVSGRRAYGQGRQVLLAFCGQLLCVIPYEVARARGHFAEEGLDVRLVYTRGGNVAMQALVGRAVDYAGTSFDVALQAYAHGAKIARFAS